MHFVAGAVEEARVDERDARGRRRDARGEVHAGAALLVHDAHLQRVARQAVQVLDTREQRVGERDFGRAVHLRLHDVDRAGARVALRLQVVQRAQRRDDAVQDAFRDLVAVAVEHRAVGHQVADVADEQQRAAMQRERAAGGRRVVAVRVQAAREGLAAFRHVLDERALHQAEPVAVELHLVVGVHRRDRILAVDDRADRRLEHDVLHVRGIGAADRRRCVDLDLDVQAVVLQQDRRRRVGRALVAHELSGLRERGDARVGIDGELAVLHAIAQRVAVRAARERRRVVEHAARVVDHVLAARRVVGRGALGAVVFRQRVGAVQRVVQAAPARVRRVQRIARVRQRHDELRAGLLGDFAVDVRGGCRDVRRCGHQVADPFEERAIRGVVAHRAGVRAVPRVEFLLQAVAFREQFAVARRQLVHQRGEAAPERCLVDAGARQRFVFDELAQRWRDLQSVMVDHRDSSRGKIWRARITPRRFVRRHGRSARPVRTLRQTRRSRPQSGRRPSPARRLRAAPKPARSGRRCGRR